MSCLTLRSAPQKLFVANGFLHSPSVLPTWPANVIQLSNIVWTGVHNELGHFEGFGGGVKSAGGLAPDNRLKILRRDGAFRNVWLAGQVGHFVWSYVFTNCGQPGKLFRNCWSPYWKVPWVVVFPSCDGVPT